MSRPMIPLAAFAVLSLAGCASVPPPAPPASSGAVAPASSASSGALAPAGVAREVTTPSGLRYVDLSVGDGALAEDGLTVAVHYVGWLADGTKFDASRDRGDRPFTFRLGAGQVIRGWDEGVRGMRVGGKRRLTIPPDLGYGERGAGGVVPPDATLVFEVDFVGVAE